MRSGKWYEAIPFIAEKDQEIRVQSLEQLLQGFFFAGVQSELNSRFRVFGAQAASKQTAPLPRRVTILTTTREAATPG